MPHHLIVSAALPKKELTAHGFLDRPLHLQQVARLKHLAVAVSNHALFVGDSGVSNVETQVNGLDNHIGHRQLA